MNEVRKHENGIVAAASSVQRRRIEVLLSDVNNRAKLIAMLAHKFNTSGPGWSRIPARLQTADSIVDMLGRHAEGEDRCYCISENADIDGRFLPVGEALSQVVGFGYGTLLSLVPGRLLYYEGEEAGCRFLWMQPMS